MRVNNRACHITQFTVAVAIVGHALLACASAPTPDPTHVVTTAPTPTPTHVVTTAPTPTPTHVVTTAPTPTPTHVVTTAPTPTPTHVVTTAPTPTPTHVVTTAPTPTPTHVVTTAPAPTPTAQDEIAIYLTVIRQLCGPDDTFGGKLRPSKLYIARRTSYLTPGDSERFLLETVQQGISQGLADLHTNVIWVDTAGAVELDKATGRVVGGGVILELGAIQPETGDKVHVFGSIYMALLIGGGATYAVEREDGKWIITGDTGRWIS